MTPGEWRACFRAQLRKEGVPASKAMTEAFTVEVDLEKSPEEAAQHYFKPQLRCFHGIQLSRPCRECGRNPRLTKAEARECAALSGEPVCQACGVEWTKHRQLCETE